MCLLIQRIRPLHLIMVCHMNKILICLVLTTMTLLLSACKSSASKNGTASPITQQPGPETGQTSLQEAALNGQAEVVDALLEQGIDINTRDKDGRTALMFAAFNGHEDIVKSLMENGADVNIMDSYGRTALMFGSTGPFPGTVKILRRVLVPSKIMLSCRMLVSKTTSA